MLSGALGNQVDGLVDSSHGRNVDGLLSDNTSSSDSSGVFSGACLDDCVDENFEGVFACKEINNLESVPDDSDGLNFFSCISSVELHASDQSLDNRAECLSELFGLISSSGVRDKNLRLGRLGCDVVNEARIIDLI